MSYNWGNHGGRPRTLTPAEQLRVAHAHLVLGVDQYTLAAIMGVNAGRIAEAVKLIRDTLEGGLKDPRAGQGGDHE